MLQEDNNTKQRGNKMSVTIVKADEIQTTFDTEFEVVSEEEGTK